MMYTKIQAEKAQEILMDIDKCNHEVGSDCSAEDIELLTDETYNIYIKYKSIVKVGQVVEDIYLKIDMNGNKVVMNYLCMDKYTLEELFLGLKPFIF